MSNTSILTKRGKILCVIVFCVIGTIILLRNFNHEILMEKLNIYLKLENGSVYRVKWYKISNVNDGVAIYHSKVATPKKDITVKRIEKVEVIDNKLKNFTYFKGNVQVYNLSLPNNDKFKCVILRQGTPTPICIYDTKVDLYVSGSLLRSGRWEGGYLNQLRSFMVQRPKANFIDFGTNLGVYTLFISKTMGRKVLAIEPYYPTIRRLHKSIKLGKLEKLVTLVVNPITDVRKKVYFRQSSNNQGDTRISSNSKYTKRSGPTSTQSILMDDLLQVTNFTEAIIKIDIQGHEMKAFSHGSKFLDKVNILAIFIEWEFYRNSGTHPLVPQFIDQMTSRGLKPYSPGKIPLALNQWRRWPLDVVFKSSALKW